MNTNKKVKRKILIITGSRGEYGYLRPIIREIEKNDNFDYELVVCNMHPLSAFGFSLDEIKKDGIKIGAVLYNTLDGYNTLTMTKSLGIFLLELPTIIDRIKPDIILIAGDRGEQLMAAIAGAHMYIPVAHIQAGELSGNIDGTTRHAIARFSHIHFAANKDAAERLKKMGEQEFRIFEVGAPQLDELINFSKISQNEIYKKFNLDKNKPIFLVVQHSVTEEFDRAEFQMNETMKAIKSFKDCEVVIIMNNSDAGSRDVRKSILNHRLSYMKVFENISRQDYAGLMKVSSVLVGNSSSGIIEAPLFKLPVINIGNRQKGRMQSDNVINVKHNSNEIKKAITKALSISFKQQVLKTKSLYGDGKSSKRILDILMEITIDDKILIKNITY